MLFVWVYESGFDRMGADCRLDVLSVIPLMRPVETKSVQSTSPPSLQGSWSGTGIRVEYLVLVSRLVC